MAYKIFIINTGSTSTKLALYEGDSEVWSADVTHSADELKNYPALLDQLPYRKAAITAALETDDVDLSGLSAVAARGGTFGFAKGGAYLVEENLMAACRNPITNHPSNLSALLAQELAAQHGCRAYIYDAVCTNEVPDITRITGLKGVLRRPFSHVLNTRAVAREVAEKAGRNYADMNFIVAHLGGGISINVHQHGQIVDLLSDDEGPMSPERAGRLNGKSYVDLCFSGEYDKKSMMRRIKGVGGLIDHLGTSDMREVEARIAAGDQYAAQVLEAMAYQIAKGIASLSAVVPEGVDYIILTGGCAHSKALTDQIIPRVRFLAPIIIKPGAMEMTALARGITRVLDGQEEAKIWGN